MNKKPLIIGSIFIAIMLPIGAIHMGITYLLSLLFNFTINHFFSLPAFFITCLIIFILLIPLEIILESLFKVLKRDTPLMIFLSELLQFALMINILHAINNHFNWFTHHSLEMELLFYVTLYLPIWLVNFYKGRKEACDNHMNGS